MNLVFLWSLFFVICSWLCWQCQLWRFFANSHPIPQVCRVSQVNYFSSQVTKVSIFQSNMKQIVVSYRSWFSFVNFQFRVFFRCIHIYIHISCQSRFKLQTFPLYIFQVREKESVSLCNYLVFERKTCQNVSQFQPSFAKVLLHFQLHGITPILKWPLVSIIQVHNMDEECTSIDFELLFLKIQALGV